MLTESRMRGRKCSIERKYFPSPYETLHFEKAEEISRISDWDLRRKELLNFIYSPAEVNRSRLWTRRVKAHMESGNNPEIIAEDHELMSKFIVTRKCTDNHNLHVHHNHHKSMDELLNISLGNASWVEWIEPLTVHARHPFSFFYQRCISWQFRQLNVSTWDSTDVKREEVVDMINSDFVLLQSGPTLYNRTIPNFGQEKGEITKHYLFDAGSSTFKSSL